MMFKLSLLLGCTLGFVLTQTQNDQWDFWWNYQPGFSGPGSWGGFNPKWRLCSIGRRQSPIDIRPADLLYDANMKHMTVSKHKVTGILKNTGHDLTVELDKDSNKIFMLDGPLSYSYRVEKMIIHFGSSNRQGSEHRVGGKSFPAEIQIYGYNDELYPNSTIAEDSIAGMAALSVFVAINETAANQDLIQLLNDAALVQYRGMEKALGKFSIFDMLPDTKNYITYEGSLTRPGCQETVTWIIMNKPVYVKESQLQLLRQTVSTTEDSVKTALGDNFRPLQSVNRRAVRTNINFPEQKSSACDMRREKQYTVNNDVV